MRAVVYARTSTLDQAREEKMSIPDQINWSREFSDEHGWDWKGEYIEPGVTGDTEASDRPALSKLLRDAEADLFDIVILYHSSRFAREPDIGMRVCRLLGQLRKQVYFRNSPIDPIDPDKFSWGLNIGGLYMTAFSFIGDFQENVARSERVRSGFKGLAQRGKLVNAPYGYKKIPEIKTDSNGRKVYSWHFEIDPQKSLVVKRIFRLYLQSSASIRKIMLILNKESVPSPSGKTGMEAWSAATIKNILNDPAYIGIVRWGRKLGGKYLQGKSVTGKQRRVFNPSDKWVLTNGDHPKIIDKSDFDRVQEKMKLRGVIKGRAIASFGLLTGLVICGRCGRKAYFKTQKYKRKKEYVRTSYICKSYISYKTCYRHVISGDKLHGFVIAEIGKLASNTTYRKSLVHRSSANKEGSLQTDLSLMLKTKSAIESKHLRILTAYESGDLTLTEFGSAKRRLDEELFAQNEQIEKLHHVLSDTVKRDDSRKKFESLIKTFSKNFNEMEFSAKKSFVQSLLESVVVNHGRIRINFRI